MSTDNTLFGFDAERMKDMFKAPGLDRFVEQMNLPVEAIVTAQQKNIEALVEANKVAVAGYQEVYGRMVKVFEEGVENAQARVKQAQGQPISAEVAAKNVEDMQAAFEKALGNLREMSEMAQKANAGAFEVIKARVDEAMAEFKGAADKIAA